MYSVKNLIKVMSYFATAVIFITAVSLFAMQDDDGRAYAADAVASIRVTPIQSVLDVSDRRTVYRYDNSTGKYRQISYYDVYDYDKIKLTVDYGGYSRSYTGSEITALTATLGAPLVISDGQSESVWGNGRHTVTYTLGTKSAKAVFTVAATRIKSLSVTPMYTINAICNVKGDYRVAADESGNISQRFEYDLAGYDYNVKIIYTDGTTVRCTAADLKQITGYEPKFSQGDKVLSVGANVGYCTVGGVTAKFSFNVIENPVKSVSLYMTGGADSLTAGNDGYYAMVSNLLSIAQIATLFITPFLMKKISKRNLFMGGMAVATVGFVLSGLTTSYSLICLSSVIKGIGFGCGGASMFGCLQDAITYGEWYNGYGTAGMGNAASSFCMKVGSGIGTAALGWILAAGGFDAQLKVQSASALSSIAVAFAWVPVITSVICVICMAFFDVDKYYGKVVEDLSQGKHRGE